MAYVSSANSLFVITGRTGGTQPLSTAFGSSLGSSVSGGGLGGQVFGYNSTDLMGTVAAVGYFTDAAKWGARSGDTIHATAWSTAVPAVYVGHATGRFTTVSSTGGTVIFASSST